jgi:hypothetical protein
LPFNVLSPTPVLERIIPAEIVAGDPLPILIAVGRGFVPGSILMLNSVALPTLVTDSGTIQGTIFPNMTRTSGIFEISVVNPDPGGSRSNPLEFVVTPGAVAPQTFRITGLNPSEFFHEPGEEIKPEFDIFGVNFPEDVEWTISKLDANFDVDLIEFDWLNPTHIAAQLSIQVETQGTYTLTVSSRSLGDSDTADFKISLHEPDPNTSFIKAQTTAMRITNLVLQSIQNADRPGHRRLLIIGDHLPDNPQLSIDEQVITIQRIEKIDDQHILANLSVPAKLDHDLSPTVEIKNPETGETSTHKFVLQASPRDMQK